MLTVLLYGPVPFITVQSSVGVSDAEVEVFAGDVIVTTGCACSVKPKRIAAKIKEKNLKFFILVPDYVIKGF